MDRARAKELREVFNAFCDGKEIQTQWSHTEEKSIWYKVEKIDGVFLESKAIFRIKPEPQVIYVNKFIDTGNTYVHETAESANRSCSMSAEVEYVAKKFIEVIE